MLDSGALSAETLVFKEGFDTFIPVRTVSDFKVPASAASGGAAASASAPPPESSARPSAAPPIAGVATSVPPLSDAVDVEQNKVYAILAYIGLLFLVPLLAAPNSKFARYHTNQGIVLFIATLVTMGGSMIVAMIPLIGCVAAILPVVIGVLAIVLMILGIINAASGQYKPLPIIGHYQILK